MIVIFVVAVCGIAGLFGLYIWSMYDALRAADAAAPPPRFTRVPILPPPYCPRCGSTIGTRADCAACHTHRQRNANPPTPGSKCPPSDETITAEQITYDIDGVVRFERAGIIHTKSPRVRSIIASRKETAH